MAYDEETVARFREALGPIDGLEEKRMMGGMCFMLNGNMVGGANRTQEGVRRFMFRIGKDHHDKGLDMPGAITMIHGDRLMSGFFYVEDEGCDDALLKRWIALALEFVETLPAK